MTTRIMVAEDDESIRQLLYYQLSGAGYEVICFKSGLQALERILHEQPDLLLLDVMMPELSGWETCRQIRTFSDIPIIMLTAKSADDDVVNGLGLGADDYVTKPFTLPLLLARIETVLRRRSPRLRAAASLHKTRPAQPPSHQIALQTAGTDPHLRHQSQPFMDSPPTPAHEPERPMYAEQPTRLGQQLASKRASLGLTLAQAGQRCGVRWEFLQAIEREHWNFIPRAELRKALRVYCEYLKVDLDAALGPPPNSFALVVPRSVQLPLFLLAFFAFALVMIGLAMMR